MIRKFAKLRTQMSISMVATAIVALIILVAGMSAFYIEMRQNWISELSEENRQTLARMLEKEDVHPDALATLIATYSETWISDYADAEFIFICFYTLLAIVVSIIIGHVIAARLSRPIEAIKDAALQVSKGELDIELDPRQFRAAEVRDLLLAFDDLTKSLKQSERELSASAAAIAHELRTPLTVLRGRLQGYYDGAFEPNKDQLKALLDQIDTLSKITSDLSILSQSGSNAYKPELSPVNLSDIAQSVLLGSAPDIKTAGMKIETAFLPAYAMAEPERIHQALNALVENAIRYAKEGELLRVETGQSDDHAYVRIIDHGPGLSDTEKQRVFDRWWRADASRNRAKGGSGLGLSVANAIVQSHFGKLTVEDLDGHSGVAFTLSLPLSPN